MTSTSAYRIPRCIRPAIPDLSRAFSINRSFARCFSASSSTRSFPTVSAISSFSWSRDLMYCWFLSRSSSSASTVSGPARNLKALSASISTP
ncbi:hypothetical protein BU65_05660 [Escherichia coli]|nr:hypothetical protein BU65_05660 [Escherichia coli]KEO99174.1 hypothetical protein EH66_01125 [Escherichia coli]